MIRLPATTLAPTALARLAEWQGDVEAESDYAARVAKAQHFWDLKNTQRNEAFRIVRRTLARMNGKLLRCTYCEDSCANQVEHIHPKTLYPELAFVWDNYLYACGLCNPEKRDQFAVFPGDSPQWVDVQRSPKAAVIPPVAGEPLLINPRIEDPLLYLILDLRGTFHIKPTFLKGSREYERATFTIDVLGLNSRSELPRCRRDAYGSYKAKLLEYIQKRSEGATARELRLLEAALKRSPHRTVWKEMQRHASRIPELTRLFEQVPQAKHW